MCIVVFYTHCIIKLPIGDHDLKIHFRLIQNTIIVIFKVLISYDNPRDASLCCITSPYVTDR